MRVLYLSYTGLLEPLGRSQVLCYLTKLSQDHQITLITFEKSVDRRDVRAVQELEAQCTAAGIRWRRAGYHQRPRLLATGWDLTALLWMALCESLRRRPAVIHSRSYVATFVALAVGLISRIPFIFDTRALWLDEMIAAGRLREGSTLHRLLAWAERRCLRSAAAVVALSEVSIPHLQQLAQSEDRQKFAVVPTCVDLARFQPRMAKAGTKMPRFGCVGTVLSGWFLADRLVAFIAAAQRHWPGSSFDIVTRDDPDLVRDRLGPIAQQPSVQVYAAAFDDIPRVMSEFDAGVMFYETGLARLNSCPTRMGEHLAVGTPVVTNGKNGDVGELITRYNVGVLIGDDTPTSMDRACQELDRLLKDADLSERCVGAAEAWFVKRR